MSITPYEDEQIPFQPGNSSIERIPLLVNPATGQIDPKFQKFYDDLINSIIDRDVKQMYKIADGSLSTSAFDLIFESFIKKLKSKATDSIYHKVDVQINMDSFKDKFRTIFGSFIVTLISLDSISDEVLEGTRTRVDKLSAELYFTYIENQFKLISFFPGWFSD